MRRWLPTAVGAALLALSVTVFSRVLGHLSAAQLLHEIHAVGVADLLRSIGFTAIAFSALVGYECFAMRFAGRWIGLRRTALGAFVAQSIAHTTGFAAVVATSLRYRIYAPCGLDLIDVAKVQGFFVFTFGLGLATIFGGVLTFEPELAQGLVPLPVSLWPWQAAGLTLLGAVLAYLIWSARRRLPYTVLGQPILPPRPWTSCGQILLAFVDLGAGAAALWVLLPDELQIAYPALLGMFIVAVILGMASHVPGALGVFEGSMLFMIGAPAEQSAGVLGALLIYRLVFYLLPFTLGCLLFGWHELDQLRALLREASGRGATWAGRIGPTAAAGAILLVLAVVLLKS